MASSPSSNRSVSTVVVVGSFNPAKVGAVSAAFTAVVGPVEVVSVAVQGARTQPIGDAETRSGAHSRALASRKANPSAGWWVGIESGLEIIGEDYLVSSWVVVMNSERVGQSRTAAFSLPHQVAGRISDELPLGTISERVASGDDWRRDGIVHTLTSGLVTRQSLYVEAILLALNAFRAPWQQLADSRKEDR